MNLFERDLDWIVKCPNPKCKWQGRLEDTEIGGLGEQEDFDEHYGLPADPENIEDYVMCPDCATWFIPEECRV